VSADRTLIDRLREVIAALDRRQPQRDGAAEGRIASDSAEMKQRAQGLIAQLEAPVSEERARTTTREGLRP
jgi:hypothetical protein